MSAQPCIATETVDSFLTTMLDGVFPTSAWGETSYFYNPGQILKRGTYLATIKHKDGENDRASKLDRPNLWRLNIGVTKPTYRALFGPPPARPGRGGVIERPWDFAQQDLITPHPVYGWMGWVAVISPSDETWERCIPLLEDAHQRAQTTFAKRTR